jgi:hypothetical protein
MPMAIFRHVIAAAGCPVTLLGPAKRMGHHDIAAAYIDVSPKTLLAVRKSDADRRSKAGSGISRRRSEITMPQRDSPDFSADLDRRAQNLDTAAAFTLQVEERLLL